MAFGTLLRLFELRWTGSDALRRGPRLVVANHPTLLDVVFLASRMPQADCIVKAEAWRNPFLRRVVEVAGYVPNSSGPEVVEACVERLRSGRSVIVFPEGTRSPHTGLHRFQRGAAHISMRSGVPMTPVVIRCNPPALKRGQPWWDVPDRKLILSLDVGPPCEQKTLRPGVQPRCRGLPARQRQVCDATSRPGSSMKTVEILESEIKELIVEALALEDLIPSELDSTEPLFDSGLGLDSIDALEIAVALEKRYGIVVDDDAGANRERFASVRSLARFVADSLPR